MSDNPRIKFPIRIAPSLQRGPWIYSTNLQRRCKFESIATSLNAPPHILLRNSVILYLAFSIYRSGEAVQEMTCSLISPGEKWRNFKVSETVNKKSNLPCLKSHVFQSSESQNCFEEQAIRVQKRNLLLTIKLKFVKTWSKGRHTARLEKPAKRLYRTIECLLKLQLKSFLNDKVGTIMYLLPLLLNFGTYIRIILLPFAFR